MKHQMVNALVDVEQAVAETAICTDLFDPIDDLVNFPGDDFTIDDSDLPYSVDDGDSDARLFGGLSSAAADNQLLAAAALNQDVDHTELVKLLFPFGDGRNSVTMPSWLSNFLDDSPESFALHLPAVPPAAKKRSSNSNNSHSDKGESLFRSSSPVSVLVSSSLAGGRAGSRGSTPSVTPSTCSSASSSSSFNSTDTANLGPFAPATSLKCRRRPPTPELLIIPGGARTKRPRPGAFSPRTTVQQEQVFVIPNLTPAIEPEAVPLPTSITTTTNSDPERYGEHIPAKEVAIKMMMKNKKPSTKRQPSLLHGVYEGEVEPEATVPTMRKCLHCEITKTPQWRAGPMGPKTLCNACGVRYKSGRLFPEYRPAASPTFIRSVHSNSHKKVVEMRIRLSQRDAAAGTPLPDNPAAKCCDLLQFIRRRE